MIKLWNERIIIKADRWPWQQGYNWRGMVYRAPLNPEGARFGGGWNYEFGISLGGFKRRSSIVLNLIFGMIRISWDLRPDKQREANKYGI